MAEKQKIKENAAVFQEGACTVEEYAANAARYRSLLILLLMRCSVSTITLCALLCTLLLNMCTHVCVCACKQHVENVSTKLPAASSDCA